MLTNLRVFIVPILKSDQFKCSVSLSAMSHASLLAAMSTSNREAAVEVMLHVHRHGVGICGVFTYDVAETKVAQVIEFARRHQHPLQCTMEKE